MGELVVETGHALSPKEWTSHIMYDILWRQGVPCLYNYNV